MNIDIAYKRFQDFKRDTALFNDNMSEADTRSKFLDKIFIDILGWNEENIEREGYVKSGYFDYEISTSQYRFVVEAKKVSIDFKLPSKGKSVKLRTLYSSNKDVLDQIRDYIQKRNIAYGIVSNGKQFIIARYINTDGSDWLDNKAYFFDGLEKIGKNFIEFYNLFSYESVIQNGRIKLVKDEIIGKHLIENKLLRKKSDEVVRNEFSDILVSVIGQIFSEIYETNDLDDYEKLEKCYVNSDDVRTSNSKLGILFEDEPPSFDSRIKPVKNTKHTQSQITDEIQKPLGPIPEPVIIIGSKGAGKTTFIKYFTEITLDKKLIQERPILYFDFRNYTKQQILDTKGVYSTIFTKLSSNYSNLKLSQINILKTIYLKEIKELEGGIWSLYKDNQDKLNEKLSDFLEKKTGDVINHLKSISEYLLKFHRKRLTIIIDNADQLDDESQKELFLLAQSIRKSLKSLVILSLREGYFYKWKNRPPFDAYQSNVFHITAPSYSEILKKRIDYVINNFDFQKINTDYKNKHLKLTSETFKNFFISLSKTLFSKRNSEILEFLEETSYPNIREGLDNFNAFLSSGHTQITDYITSDSYNIPIWEFIQSIALESQYYYKSDFSRISNILNPALDNKNHFTKIRLLFYLFYQAETHSFKSFFESTESILELFLKAGYGKNIIINELTELLRFKLIETKSNQSDIEILIDITENSEIKITQAGIYYLNKLLPRLHYLDLVLQDTPIFNEYFFERLKDTFPEVGHNGKRDLGQRLINVTTFLEYLQKMEWYDHSKNELNYGHKAFDINIIEFIKENGFDIDTRRIEKVVR